MSSLVEDPKADVQQGGPHDDDGVAAYLRERASPYAARVSAWWLEVTQREGCKPMSYYDQ